MGDISQRLPTELLHHSLETLPQPALLVAARVSKRWRTVATGLPNFYRYHHFAVPEPGLEEDYIRVFSSNDDIDVFESVVREADELNQRLGLRIAAFPDDDTDTDDPWMENGLRFRLNLLVPILRRAARLLVTLSLHVVDDDAHIILEALCTPAPRLRNLELSVVTDGITALSLPAYHFGGQDPRLVSTHLERMSVSLSGPQYRTVRHLTLGLPSRQHQYLDDVNARFPEIRHLDIPFLEYNTPRLLSPRDFVIFERLDSLILGQSVQLTYFVPAFDAIRHIPVLEFAGWECTDCIAQFMSPSGPSELVIEEHIRPRLFGNYRRDGFKSSQLRMSMAFAHHPDVHGPARRTFDFDLAHPESYALLVSFGVVTNLTAVHVDDRQVRTFMDTLGTLPALSTLSILLVNWAQPSTELWEADLICEDCGARSCACCGKGGYFADGLDDSWPAEPHTPPLYPALRTLMLRAARASSSIAAEVPLALARALSPGPCRLLDLELWDGLTLASDGADTGSALDAVFRSVASFGLFDGESRTVTRVALLRKRTSQGKSRRMQSSRSRRAALRTKETAGAADTHAH